MNEFFNMLTIVPSQKLTIFLVLTLILFFTDGLMISTAFGTIGKWILYTSFSWYSSCAIINHLINKYHQIGHLDKRAVLITGCDTGFGHSTALRLNELGFHVIATCLDASGEGASKLWDTCCNYKQMHVIQLDVTDQSQLDKLVINVRQLLHEKQLVFHAIINNAGIAWAAPVEYGDFNLSFDQVLKVNLIAPIRITRQLLPLIRESRQKINLDGDARIINLCSQASTFHVSPITAYCISKAGLLAFTNALRQEVDHLNIRTVSIEPGFFSTELTGVDAAVRNISRMLGASDPEVLHAYGVDFSKLNLNPIESVMISKKPHMVVDSITDAVMAVQPEMRYTVAEPLDKFMYVGMSLLPVEIFYYLGCFGRWILKCKLKLCPSASLEEKFDCIHAEKAKDL